MQRIDILRNINFFIAKDASMCLKKLKNLKNMDKKLSIIIPVFNERESLSKWLDC